MAAANLSWDEMADIDDDDDALTQLPVFKWELTVARKGKKPLVDSSPVVPAELNKEATTEVAKESQASHEAHSLNRVETPDKPLTSNRVETSHEAQDSYGAEKSYQARLSYKPQHHFEVDTYHGAQESNGGDVSHQSEASYEYESSDEDQQWREDAWSSSEMAAAWIQRTFNEGNSTFCDGLWYLGYPNVGYYETTLCGIGEEPEEEEPAKKEAEPIPEQLEQKQKQSLPKARSETSETFEISGPAEASTESNSFTKDELEEAEVTKKQEAKPKPEQLE
jgi:hypothetical protein